MGLTSGKGIIQGLIKRRETRKKKICRIIRKLAPLSKPQRSGKEGPWTTGEWGGSRKKGLGSEEVPREDNTFPGKLRGERTR